MGAQIHKNNCYNHNGSSYSSVHIWSNSDKWSMRCNYSRLHYS